MFGQAMTGAMGSLYQQAQRQRQQQQAAQGFASMFGQPQRPTGGMNNQQAGPMPLFGQQQGAMGQQQQAAQRFNTQFGTGQQAGPVPLFGQQGNPQMGMPGKGLGQQMMGQQGGCPPWMPNCQGGGGGGGGFTGHAPMMGRVGLQNILGAAAPAPTQIDYGFPTGSTHGPQDYQGTSATGTPLDGQAAAAQNFNTRFGIG